MPRNIIGRLADGFAEQSSRRRFLAVLGKVAVGIAGLSIGERLTLGTAEASGNWACCSGPSICNQSNGGCPPNTSVTYYWYCCNVCGDCYTYICADCKTSSGTLVCVLVAKYGGYPCSSNCNSCPPCRGPC